jgi:hypothetical protein
MRPSSPADLLGAGYHDASGDLWARDPAEAAWHLVWTTPARMLMAVHDEARIMRATSRCGRDLYWPEIGQPRPMPGSSGLPVLCPFCRPWSVVYSRVLPFAAILPPRHGGGGP